MNKYTFKVKTNHPIAIDSPDHLEPLGTRLDNNTKLGFIADIEKRFSERPLRFMDLGCSGGRLIHDFLRSDHLAIGLEGSDYSIKHQRAEWPKLHQKNLFTCDISKKFEVTILEESQAESPFLCDAISAWEVVEHIHPKSLTMFFENIRQHLKLGGQFFASVSVRPDFPHHQSAYPEHKWRNEILPKLEGLVQIPYPFNPRNAVRFYLDSIYVCLKRIS